MPPKSSGQAHRASSEFDLVDTDKSGTISLEEFKAALNDKRVLSWLHALELQSTDAVALFNLLDDGDGGGISYSEFIHGAKRVKGHAQGIDIVTLMHQHAQLALQIRHLENALRKKLNLETEFPPRCGRQAKEEMRHQSGHAHSAGGSQANSGSQANGGLSDNTA